MAVEPTCRACGAPLSAVDKFCGHCGTKVDGQSPVMRTTVPPGQPPITAEAAPPRPQPQNVYVYGATQQQGYYPPPPSSTFAIVTLLLYFFMFPVGALLNIIGLLTGPRRGCFAAMIFFILLPTLLIATVVIILLASGAVDPDHLDRGIQIEKLIPPKN